MAGPRLETSGRLETADHLSPQQVRAVGQLVDTVTAADDVAPLSEQVMLSLHHGGGGGARHLLLWGNAQVGAAARLDGYAQLADTDAPAPLDAEIAVSPTAPSPGTTTTLTAALRAHAGERLRIWARGQRSPLVAAAQRLGMHSERVLLQLRRSLAEPLPDQQWPDGVTVRTFVVGQDEAAWVAVNNRAFQSHPDQSGWSTDDITVREQEPWFDPAGFFLAERDGKLVGFHWTKVHGGSGHHPEPIGEVYVVGVDPSMQGQRLGGALTLRGLEHLRDRGLTQVMLYVDETNLAAVAVYERLGFTRYDADVCFRF